MIGRLRRLFGVLLLMLCIGPPIAEAQVVQKPAGPPPTPAHTGVKAMLKGLIGDFRALPGKENLFIAAVGGAAALAVHPADDSVNAHLVGKGWAKNVFAPGATIGSATTLLPVNATVYVVGRWRDQPKVSHLGMDLLRSLAVAEGVVQTIKYATRRERPDGSGRNSFPSGHSADTFAVATALERHLGWRGAVPAYLVASYVAASRMRENRHFLSDVVFGAAVGTIAGRTVTRHGREYYVDVHPLRGGAEVVIARRTIQ